jgi:hypothetical protein
VVEGWGVVVLGVPVVFGVLFGDRWVFEFPFMLPVVPVVDGLVVSGKVPGVAGVVPGVVGVVGDTGLFTGLLFSGLFGKVDVPRDVGFVDVPGLVGAPGVLGVVEPGDVGVLGTVVVPGDVGVVGVVCGIVCAPARPANAETTKMAGS